MKKSLSALGVLAAPLVFSLVLVATPKVALFLAALLGAGPGAGGLLVFAALASAAAAGLQAGTGAFGIALL